MLGVLIGFLNSLIGHFRLVLGVEFFHAGIGDLFPAMLQSTSTAVVYLGSSPVPMKLWQLLSFFWGLVKRGGKDEKEASGCDFICLEMKRFWCSS